MKAEQAHAVLSLRTSGCTHPLVEDLYQSPMNRCLDRDQSQTLLDLCADHDIKIAIYHPTLEDLAR